MLGLFDWANRIFDKRDEASYVRPIFPCPLFPPGGRATASWLGKETLIDRVTTTGRACPTVPAVDSLPFVCFCCAGLAGPVFRWRSHLRAKKCCHARDTSSTGNYMLPYGSGTFGGHAFFRFGEMPTPHVLGVWQNPKPQQGGGSRQAEEALAPTTVGDNSRTSQTPEGVIGSVTPIHGACHRKSVKSTPTHGPVLGNQ